MAKNITLKQTRQTLDKVQKEGSHMAWNFEIYGQSEIMQQLRDMDDALSDYLAMVDNPF